MDFTSWMLLISAWAYITPFDPNHKGPGRAELPLISARLLLCMISISHLIWNCNIRSLTLSLGTWIGSITHCLGIEIGLPIVGPFFHWPFFTMAGIWRPFQTQDTAENQTKGVSGCEWARQLLSARTDDEFIAIINQYWDWNHVCCQKIESWSCQPLSPTTFPTQKSSFCTLGTTNRCNHKQAQTLNNLLNLQRVFSLAFLQLFWTHLKYHVKDKPDVQLVLEVTLECWSPLLLLHLLHDKLSNKEVYKIN